MITAEKTRPKIYSVEDEFEDIENIDEVEDEEYSEEFPEDDEEYSEEFLDELDRIAEETFRKIDSGEIKPVSREELALICGVTLNE